MCGINGIYGSPDATIIRKMNKVLNHRGPDQEGVYIDDKIALGHKRLSIIDLSEKGRQPMTYDGLTIVFNGEIYNFKELKQELGGKFESESDTEVILNLYKRYRENCLKYLRGMFAFAIWDGKELFIAVVSETPPGGRILARVNGGGEVFISHTVLRGVYTLRVAIGNLNQ